MIGQTLSHFKILSKIGEGGMGVVYEAEDTKLNRRVAIKILPPEQVGSDERRLRFLREARAAAGINHPNIATVHEVDEVDGVVFIAMELVNGTSLRTTLKGERLPLAKSLRIAGEIAGALAGAHSSGIVHRDLKPDNVMIREDGHVKLLDFGLAKFLEEPPAQDESTRLATVSAEMTKAGRVFGTAAYMSPEQARGQAVDARSDVFSFGTLLYEMVAGESPFHGPTVTDTLSSIVRDQPRPTGEINPDVPPELDRILAKCLEKEAAERYQHTDELAMDLRKLLRTTDSQPIASVSAEIPTVRRRPWILPAVAAAVLVVLASVFVIWRGAGGTGAGSLRSSLAVLPFENLVDGEENRRLGQVLQELIITDLSGLDSLTVFSSQRLYDLRKQIGGGEGREIDRSVATEVASMAGAGMMLTGSLSRLGSNWIVTGQIVDVGNGRVVQSERIDGADLYKMVDQLTARIRSDLNLGLDGTSGADLAVSERTASSLDAQKKYLEGAELLDQNRFEDAVAAFREASNLDPKFGLARLKHALAIWWAYPDDTDPETGVTAAELLRDLQEGDYKLGEQDKTRAEGLLAVLEKRHGEAEIILKKLVASEPNDKEAWYVLGEAGYHNPTGDRKAAYQAFERAMDLDPTFQLPYRHLREMYRDNRDFRRGIEVARRFIGLDPDNITYYQELVRLLIFTGDVAEADRVVEEALGRLSAQDQRQTFLRRAAGDYGLRIELEERQKELLDRALALAGKDAGDYEFYEIGQYHRSRLENRRAEESYLRSLEINPKGGGALFSLFNLYADEARYAEGILKARSLVQRDPGHLPYYHEWIAMAIRKGDDEETDRAVRDARSAARTDRDRLEILNVTADAYESVGDSVRRLGALQEARELSVGPDSGRSAVRVAHTLLRLRRFEEAEEQLQTALGVDRDLEWWPMTVRMALALEAGRYEDARRYADQAIELEPIYVWMRTFPMMPDLLAGRLDEAERYLGRILAEAELPRYRRNNLVQAANAFISAGYFPQAEAAVRRALEETPEDRIPDWFSQALAISLARQEKFDEAEKVLRQARDLHPRNPYLRLTMARLDLLRDDPAAAERRLRDLLADGPASLETFELLAWSLAARGEFREAEVHARKALSMRPNREQHVLLAWVLIKGEVNVQEGIDLARQSLDLPFPRSAQIDSEPWPTAEHALGLGYLKRQRYKEAVEMLEKAAAINPHDEELRKHLAEARRGAGTAGR